MGREERTRASDEQRTPIHPSLVNQHTRIGWRRTKPKQIDIALTFTWQISMAKLIMMNTINPTARKMMHTYLQNMLQAEDSLWFGSFFVSLSNWS